MYIFLFCAVPLVFNALAMFFALRTYAQGRQKFGSFSFAPSTPIWCSAAVNFDHCKYTEYRPFTRKTALMQLTWRVIPVVSAAVMAYTLLALLLDAVTVILLAISGAYQSYKIYRHKQMLKNKPLPSELPDIEETESHSLREWLNKPVCPSLHN